MYATSYRNYKTLVIQVVLFSFLRGIGVGQYTGEYSEYSDNNGSQSHGSTKENCLQAHDSLCSKDILEMKQQINKLEAVYQDMLALLGLDKQLMTGYRRSISSTSSLSKSVCPRHKQRRPHDIK